MYLLNVTFNFSSRTYSNLKVDFICGRVPSCVLQPFACLARLPLVSLACRVQPPPTLPTAAPPRLRGLRVELLTASMAGRPLLPPPQTTPTTAFTASDRSRSTGTRRRPMAPPRFPSCTIIVKETEEADVTAAHGLRHGQARRRLQQRRAPTAGSGFRSRTPPTVASNSCGAGSSRPRDRRTRTRRSATATGATPSAGDDNDYVWDSALQLSNF